MVTEETPLDRIREALDAVAKAGPFVVGLSLHPVTWERLRDATTLDPRTPGQVLGAVPVRLDERLPRGALRWAWSDGRVTTRWPLVLDPKAAQMVFREETRKEVHRLRMLSRRSWYGWVPAWRDDAGRVVEHVWKGPRVTAYLPGVSDLLKRELEPWQRDMLASLLKTRKAVGHVPSAVLVSPRQYGRSALLRALNPETPPEG